MHLLPIQSRSMDEEALAVDLGLAPADILLLSFTDTDLGVAAAAWEGDRAALPSLRLINLSRLKHPYSVDLFIETLASKARYIIVRLLGGSEYWRYGLDELAAISRRHGIGLAVLPGDDRDDPRLIEASTVESDEALLLNAYFQAGGVGNMRQVLRFVATRIGEPLQTRPPRPVPPAGVYRAACRPAAPGSPHALILLYRSVLLAADTAPILALADAFAARGARVTGAFVTSLKDRASALILEGFLTSDPPNVIVTTTAFSARERDGCILDAVGVPVVQAILSGSDRETWEANARGLRAADLAMNVVLPEVDGRIGAGVLSFKAETESRPGLAFSRVVHRPEPDRVAHVADSALAWAALQHTPRKVRRLTCVLSDYPGKQGRGGFAVGLDTPASVVAIADHLRAEGFDIGALPPSSKLMAELTSGPMQPLTDLETYRGLFAALPSAFRASVLSAWGDPADDEACFSGAFQVRLLRAGKLLVTVQPDRGSAANRRAEYHDAALPPRHGYIAFYLWLRHVERCHAIIHLGTHGTLEWLPGKAVALSADCAPAVLTGAMPVIYPFIVNNPGEAAQAKRRIGAVTLGHLTPPLIPAGTHGDTAELEQLFDEYSEAVALDGRRARLLASAILDQAEAAGLLPKDADRSQPDEALATIDAWLCDIKEMRIGDGLHVFGHSPEPRPGALTAEGHSELVSRSGPAELASLVKALDGRFVPAGPAGAPERGRLDVLPTGRNLYSIDPRAIPTRTAWQLGSRMAEDLATRYAQDHGDWPRSVVLDLWGSATMRTGGEDLAQAFALLGARPVWDHSTTRVTGFEVLPLARLGRSRVDVTLRISGLFRDTFPEQVALFDAAVRTIAGLDEPLDDNPLAAARHAGGGIARIYGAAPGAYGVGLARRIEANPAITRDELGEAYLAATSHAFDGGGQGVASPGFRDRVARAEAFSHTGDLPGQDSLDFDTFAEHEGGFAAAAGLLGSTPALYRADTTDPDATRLRSLEDDITRAVRARATNPRWIAGQMRHGHRGAISIAETLDALYAYAATTSFVPSRHFDRYFDATLGDDTVRSFLMSENPIAARGMARKFDFALQQNYWTSQRNSTRAILALLQDEAVTDEVHVAEVFP